MKANMISMSDETCSMSVLLQPVKVHLHILIVFKYHSDQVNW